MLENAFQNVVRKISAILLRLQCLKHFVAYFTVQGSFYVCAQPMRDDVTV